MAKIRSRSKKNKKSSKVSKSKNRAIQIAGNSDTIAKYARPVSMTSTKYESLIEKICSLNDPFCRGALGVLYPDGMGSYTIPFQSRYILTLATDANGNGALSITPFQPVNAYVGASSISTSTGVITWGSSVSDPNYTSLNSNFESFRCVNWGAKIMTTEPWTTAQGVCILGLPPAGITQGTFYNNTLSGYMESEAFAVRDLLVYTVGRPFDKVLAREFVVMATASTTVPPFFPLIVALNGCAASTNVLSIEVIANFELKTIPGSFMSQMAVPAAKSQSGLLDLVDRAASSVPAFVKDGVGEVVKEAALMAISAALPAPFNPFTKKGVKLLTNRPAAIEVD